MVRFLFHAIQRFFAAPTPSPAALIPHKVVSFAKRIYLFRLWESLAVISFLGMVLWYGWFEPPYLRYLNLPFEVKREPHAGESVTLKVVRCNSDPIEHQYLISHSLISLEVDTPPEERVSILAPGLVPIKPGCTTEESNANPIPAGKAPGRYFVEGHAEVHGTLRTHSVYWRSAPFRVLPTEPAPPPAVVFGPVPPAAPVGPQLLGQ